MSESHGREFSDEQWAVLEQIVEGLSLSDAEKRLLAGHADPDAACVLNAVGKMLMFGVDPVELCFVVGVSVARTNPAQVRGLVGRVVNGVARGLINDLVGGLDFPDSEGNR
ncbi:hypothetical protein [Salinispora tropica]|uniref:Uncharacterized protein n=1 Tax=Salinispora tropica (strain ATCC BAA-916 / DSM 44818 / JCM 13857 / NBRC 105044 / CNB-440) TaxID=369723 RepID=A4X2D8_SALTO|nr:hypothetical protein [Salinispora tropica]ABP53038.1 hypothetical protein Strop_0556 [Salinispora tropica CNB-440]